MSLRHFHIVFIAASLALMVFLLGWAARQASAGVLPLDVAAAGAGGLLALVPYLGWVLKTKAVR